MKIKRRITKCYFDLACQKYAPLVKKLSFMIGVDVIHAEELQSRSGDEILKCLICFDGRGSFMTFLYTRLRGVFRHMRDMENRARRIQSISMETMINISEKHSNMDTDMVLQECLECLNKEELNIVVDLYLNEKTMRQVAEERGSVASTICRIKTRAIDKMQQKHRVGVK